MGILGENDYENLRMMNHSIEMFWHVFLNARWFDDEIIKAWALALLQYEWLSGCDTIPTLLYNHDTRIWVGLDWNFIYLGMSSLTAKVWAEATLWRLSTCAVPKMIVGHG